MGELKTNKKNTGIVVVAIVLAVVLLLALLIPTWVNASKHAKLCAEYQENNDKKIAAIVEKLDATNSLTIEEIQDAISDEIEKYHKDDAAPLTEAKVKEIINSVLASTDILTEAKVKEIVEGALKGVGGLTEAEVKKLVAKALENSGLTEAKVKEIIEKALKGVDGLTEAEVKKIVADALANINFGLTEEQVKDLIEEALKNDPDVPEDPRAVEDKLEDGVKATLSGDHTLDRAIEIPVGSHAVLDLNGHTLTVAHEDVDDLISVLGSLTVTNGTIVIERPEDKNAINFYSGLCVEVGGALNFNNVNIIGDRLWNVENNGTLQLTNSKFTVTGGFGIANSGAAVVKNCTMVADGEATSQIYSTGGTVDVVNTKFVEGPNFVSYNDHAPIENYYTSKLTMTGVTVTVTPGEMVYAFSNGLGATTTINSGEFNTVFTCGNQGGTVTIYGGTFCGIAYENLTAKSQIFVGYKFNLTKGTNCWTVSQ